MSWNIDQMNQQTNDRKLWNDFKRGETQALSQIYYQYADLLFRYGKKFSTDNELVKDTIQDLFFDLIRTRSTIGTTDHIYFYLIKAFRRRLFQSKTTLPNLRIENDNIDILAPQIIYSIEEEWIKKEELTHKEEIIRKGLAELSPKQREILYYRFTCDFEYDLICEIMAMKYDSARKMVFRALKTLKEHLTETNFTFFILHLKRSK